MSKYLSGVVSWFNETIMFGVVVTPDSRTFGFQFFLGRGFTTDSEEPLFAPSSILTRIPAKDDQIVFEVSPLMSRKKQPLAGYWGFVGHFNDAEDFIDMQKALAEEAREKAEAERIRINPTFWAYEVRINKGQEVPGTYRLMYSGTQEQFRRKFPENALRDILVSSWIGGDGYGYRRTYKQEIKGGTKNCGDPRKVDLGQTNTPIRRSQTPLSLALTGARFANSIYAR